VSVRLSNTLTRSSLHILYFWCITAVYVRAGLFPRRFPLAVCVKQDKWISVTDIITWTTCQPLLRLMRSVCSCALGQLLLLFEKHVWHSCRLQISDGDNIFNTLQHEEHMIATIQSETQHLLACQNVSQVCGCTSRHIGAAGGRRRESTGEQVRMLWLLP
jgi:hypothetical protein